MAFLVVIGLVYVFFGYFVFIRVFFFPVLLFRLCSIFYSNTFIKVPCTKQRSWKVNNKSVKKTFRPVLATEKALLGELVAEICDEKKKTRKRKRKGKMCSFFFHFGSEIERNWPQCIVALLYQKLNMLSIFYAFYKYFNSYRLSFSFIA